MVAAALHIYACRVLQRLIEHCGHRPELLDLLQDLMVPGGTTLGTSSASGAAFGSTHMFFR